jgi:hypothetical protein
MIISFFIVVYCNNFLQRAKNFRRLFISMGAFFGTIGTQSQQSLDDITSQSFYLILFPVAKFIQMTNFSG